ncbi:UDP-N-acetylmuramoyl-tripeptide--D-alanyl-D-alan ine ligase [Desulfonema ishimotonii]|uniref:UDP-N-acetylmuramoyl-tripeptide--D-alanyl-D-alanine ligase n=1 Tax=Desulfonema ishimotonii TaxID=45657 RepID=A0A401FYD7_9BACT|nr:UDP-N-acetylmuramoyl-tripeptide--D-alanyl-D-alanine ligase [Desulfonema ishimotonii]GBC61981.1 UDP-N-acetylmuramoyl-tripeptide--D-alanyl-D-alan ine ligase [Desulfonema ishimotonii]
MSVIPWTGGDILEATGGERVCGPDDIRFTGIGIDSRTITPEQAFVAIRGAVHDGHRFAADVADRGIRGLILCREDMAGLPWRVWADRGIFCVAVPDTTRALGDLAAFHRQRAGIPVVAVTGSNGKTTTRAMISGVMGRKYKTLSTRGNFNNEIGLPLTLFNLTSAHQWAVLELGMNHVGEIRRLARICRPDVGVITNIGPAHLEGLGTVDDVLRAKGELPEEMRPEGKAVLNGDDPRLVRLAGEMPQPVTLFGLSPKAQVRALEPEADGTGTVFTLALPRDRIRVRLGVPGRFMVYNALAAAAVGHITGLSPEEIRDGLEGFAPVRGRMAVLNTAKGVHLVDDTYNANPASVKGAIRALGDLRGKERGFLVLGDMLELGNAAEGLHREIGEMAAASGVTQLYVTGEFTDAVIAGALAGGMACRDLFRGSRQEITDQLTGVLGPGDWVLVKGSRGMAMEKVLDAIRDWAGC